MTRTLPELAREALLVQDACNLSGMARSFARAMADLATHIPHTGERNTHYITRVWVDKIAQLAGMQTSDSAILTEFRRCRELADSESSPVRDLTT
jgi:hypothetical protein